MKSNQKITELLTELKEKFFISGLKIELSSEYLVERDFEFLKEIIDTFCLNLTVKTSGSEDESGIINAVKMGADNVVVPMVESAYALSKFIKLVKKHSENINIFANIETITGYKNIDEILKESKDYIEGIVFGRSDFCASLGLTCEEVNSSLIFDYAKLLSSKIFEAKKKFYVGGCVSSASVPFFDKLPFLSGFETRKVVFDAQVLETATADAIKKALEFELLWLQSKNANNLDLERIEIIKKRYLP